VANSLLCRDSQREAVESAVTAFGSRGIRCLAIARTLHDDDNYIFAALLTFLDPPRPDTKETIHRAYMYGVDVKMITGDQLLIAKETARQLSMGDNISEATGLPEFAVGSSIPKDLATKFGNMCFEADGFAQVRTQSGILDLENSSPLG
jgi:H+-transporting ATPase